MKIRKVVSCILAGAALLCAAVGLFPQARYTALAGSSSKVILSDKDVFVSEVNLNDLWYTKDSVGIQYNKAVNTIRWDETTDVSSTLVYRTKPTITEWDGVILSVETTVSLKELAGDKSFGVYVGIPRLDFKADDATNKRYRGATYVYAQKGTDGKYYAGVTYLGENETTLVENVFIGENATVHFWIEQYDGGRLTVSCGTGNVFQTPTAVYDSDVYNVGKQEENDVFHDIGLVGLGGRGAYTSDTDYHVVDFKHVKLTNYYESTPMNFNAYETFEADHVNGNLWAIGGSAYIGGGMLNFVNGTSATGIRTKHYFSNFELSFDIPKLQREPIYDENGNKLYDSCHRFQVIFGVNANSSEECTDGIDALAGPKGYNRYAVGFYPAMGGDGYSTSTILFHGDSFAGLEYVPVADRASSNPASIQHDLFNPINDGRTYNVRIRIVDGDLKVYVKWEDETEYTCILDRDIGFTPEGYVQFYCGINSSQRCTLSLDNVRIVNLDKSPLFVDAGFSESGYPNRGDYIWVDNRDPNDLIGNGTIDNTFFGADMVVGYLLLGGSIVFLAFAFVVFLVKKGGKKR